MKFKTSIAALIMILSLLIPSLPACSPTNGAEGFNYAAVVPAILPAGSSQAVSLTLFESGRPVSDKVELAILKDKNEILKVKQTINGKGSIPFQVPDVAEGEYTIRVKGNGFEDEAKVKIERSFLVFLETDKPIYQPGQTVHIRVLTLDAELKPMTESVTVEVLDAKGTKIFRQDARTDDFGMDSLDLPVSTEPNLGVWKIKATTAKTKTELDVRVEEYVLPKYEVNVELPKEWFLVSEPIKGKVTAEYTFGKPVKGDLEIKASRYVGQWQQYTTLSIPIDGSADFSLPAVGYVAGVPGAGGSGNVQIEFTVTEQSTGYQEKTTQLLTITQSTLILQIIPSGTNFKPGLPFNILIVSETPDNKLVDTKGKIHINYYDKDLKEIKSEEKSFSTSKGKTLIGITPPDNGIALNIECTAQDAQATKALEAGYSPSGNFIHLEQTSEGTPSIGDEIRFKIYSTDQATNFYYEVISRGKVVFTDFTSGQEIVFKTTPLMAPSSRLLVYQILPNSEVAADYLPFNVTADYPLDVTAQFSRSEAKPGDEVNININTGSQAEVGLAVVDKSVFILAENRLNLQQVFAELEELYMKPQAELHEVSIYQTVITPGAKEVFQEAGVVLLTNNKVPEGKEYQNKQSRWLPGIMLGRAEDKTAVQAPTAAPSAGAGLAEVQRIRQFFPETWLWQEVVTDNNGKASVKVTVPDNITTWMLRAVAISKKSGLGVVEGQLKAFQPFFLTIDLPYSAIRGEEFPVRVAIYNYLDQPQSVLVQIEPADWFELLDSTEKTVEIRANDIGGVEFKIKPRNLGFNQLKITARSKQAADAVIKPLLVEAEGVAKEMTDNFVLTSGNNKELNTSIPPFVVSESGRAYLTLTASYLTQTIEGLEGLLQMPFGCGEQNMIVFAPDVFIARYLKESGQLKPEIMAKAEKLMLTGYQREMTYRRSDGSFSAFGQSDKEGSLWLTAFVLKCFSQAKNLIYIDDEVLSKAQSWITSHQNQDGSFNSVGFVHHQEMIGGLKGKTALTAYVAIALMQAGEKTASAKAVSYLESKLSGTEDAYTLALTAYALELADSGKSQEAYNKLMKLAKENENGLYWGDALIPEPVQPQEKMGVAQPGWYPPIERRTAEIETTGYAIMALLQHKDNLNASKSARWLTSQRNSYGGFGSTQDTVVGLEALIQSSASARADVDLTVNVEYNGQKKGIRITPSNSDVLQVLELPVNSQVKLSIQGKGEAIAQLVRRFNLPAATQQDEILKINVNYDVTEVAVNDIVKVSAEVSFNPPEPMEAGMTVVDISVPTGFEAVRDSITQMLKQQPKIKRYDIAGRKVIFYIENMLPGDRVAFSFNVKALYPVKAKGVVSQAYAYYKPEIAGETLGREITVVSR